MSNEPPEPLCGATCLSEFAEYLNKSLTEDQTMGAAAPQTHQYVLVHLYLVPRSRTDRRRFREAIVRELAEHGAIQLHDLAFAVPASRGEGMTVAEAAWNALMNAAANDPPRDRPPQEESGTDAWVDGDVVYVHFVGHEGLCVLAGKPRTGRRLAPAPYAYD